MDSRGTGREICALRGHDWTIWRAKVPVGIDARVRRLQVCALCWKLRGSVGGSYRAGIQERSWPRLTEQAGGRSGREYREGGGGRGEIGIEGRIWAR